MQSKTKNKKIAFDNKPKQFSQWYSDYNFLYHKIEKELTNYIRHLDKTYSLSKASPLLSKSIKDFVSRKGKRVRPFLFILGYLGFTKAPAPRFYKSALSFELLHDFLLVHDDIVDKSATRRGKPTLHKIFDNYLKKYKRLKFNGQDLAIVAGDVIYAMAVDAFLSIGENMQRKEKALKNFISAAIYTGMGEFIELLSGIKAIEKMTKQDIYKIYDYKTAYYTFAAPLSTGAILAGAKQKQIKKLHRYGTYLGRAFQIKDDILGLFGEEKKIGKSALTDLQEGKKTLILWRSFQNSSRKDRLSIKRILSKAKVNKGDLLKMRNCILASGALDYARKEISRLLKRAKAVIKSSGMRAKYKDLLKSYSEELLST